MALHPKIEVEVFSDDARTNVIAEGFDAGVRLSETVERDMTALRLTQPFKWVIVGAPAYFSRFGRPARLEDLARHKCVRFRKRPREAIEPWTLKRGGRNGQIAVSGPLVVNDAASAVSAALSAIGLAYLPYPIVEPHVHNGDLESVLAGVGLQSDGAWLYYPPRRQALPRLRAFVDFVRRRSRAD
jgi:DNA-binding transcriptional LysR family regulator